MNFFYYDKIIHFFGVFLYGFFGVFVIVYVFIFVSSTTYQRSNLC